MTEAASGGESPPRLDLDVLETYLSQAGGLLLCLDFDGTLTPIVDDADAPELSPANERTLRRLVAAERVEVLVISGRALADLQDRVGIDGIGYAGNHGLEVYQDGETTVHEAAEDARPLIRTTVERLRERLADVPGASVEDKGVTATVHDRAVPDDQVESVRQAVEAAIEPHRPGRIELQEGKSIVELRPSSGPDKGVIVRRFADAVGPDWFTIYIGDDTTDEDAFQVLAAADRALGIRVGEGTGTAASYRLADPAAVEHVLSWLADEGVDLVA